MCHSPIERLESRRLLSITLSDGTLYVRGTGFRENVLIREDRDQMQNPVIAVEMDWPDLDRPAILRTFPLDSVRSIVVQVGGNNDVVDLAIATYAVPAVEYIRPVRVPSRIDGGLGNDLLYGGNDRDSIYGSYGADTIFGIGGRDWVTGGPGRDRIWGGADDDVLFGNGGDDDIRGEGGNDVIFGNDGDDTLGGDFGDDRIYGGAGNDWLGSVSFGPLPNEGGDDFLSGGTGADRLLGGPGKDQIYGNDGRDTFFDADSQSEMKDRTPDEPIEPWADPV
jgi:Ca2+-binding RTX toxin-like protein